LQTADKDKDMVLDFCEVDIVDSVFIGGILMLRKKMDAKDKIIYLKCLNKHLKDLFFTLNLKNFID
jgi:anti-anti-sigma regulatory factor